MMLLVCASIYIYILFDIYNNREGDLNPSSPHKGEQECPLTRLLAGDLTNM